VAGASVQECMEQHEPVVLKVMRLRRPQVEAPVPMLPDFGAGASGSPKLLLPMSLTQSLVGEPFAGYLHLANISTVPVTHVVLKVELQIGPTSRYMLFNNASSPVATIEPDDFFDTDVEHELRHAGTYVLTCHVSYTLPGAAQGEPGVFKRSYRFPAMQPFAVAHRVAQVDQQLLVECSVENATTGSIYLASWRLDCADSFEASLVAGDLSSGGDASIEGTMQLLKPRGAHSFVFRVNPKSDTASTVDVRQLDMVGSLALGWHVPDGPSGCAEGYQLKLKPCAIVPLDLRVVQCPKEVHVEVPFQLELEVINRGSRAVTPSIVADLRLMGGIRIHGAAQQSVGHLQPSENARLPLSLLVALPGLHGFQGLSLVDELTGTRTEFGVICDILAF